MVTAKKRINISVSKEVDAAIGVLARRDRMPRATKAAHLLRLALELEEDEVLESIVARRDTPNAQFVSHEEAWR